MDVHSKLWFRNSTDLSTNKRTLNGRETKTLLLLVKFWTIDLFLGDLSWNCQCNVAYRLGLKGL